MRSVRLPSGARSRRCHAGRGLPLQVGHRGLGLGLGLRGVVDDLTLVGGDAVDRVEQDRRVVHGNALEHRAHALAADLGALVVVGRGADVERATADELHRVGEVGQRQQAADRALRRVVDVVEVRQPVGRDVQDLLDVVAVLGEQRREVGELADLGRSRASLFSLRKPRTSPSAWFSVPRVASRSAELSASTCDTDATWLANCTICSLLFDSALTSTWRLRTVPNRSVRESPSRPAVCESSRSALRNESPLPSKVSAAWLTNSLSGPGNGALLRSELGAQLGELLLDLVPLHGHAGAVEAHLGAVGQRRAAGVGRRELNEPGGHQVRRDDDRLRISRQLDVVAQLHGDLDVGGARLDRLDGAYRHADHPHVVAG